VIWGHDHVGEKKELKMGEVNDHDHDHGCDHVCFCSGYEEKRVILIVAHDGHVIVENTHVC